MSTPTLTRALVGLHGAGRADTYGAALLDVAQDHLLWLLAELGFFMRRGPLSVVDDACFEERVVTV